ncbi:MAG: hypothetical protein H7840_02665 [Alphaproteobacteria bacterium]
MVRRATPDLDALRRQLKGSLPKRIGKAVDSYDGFSTAPPPDDAKGFAAHHAACRAALAHVEMLVKLSRWAEGKEEATSPEGEGEDIDRLIAEARSAIRDMADAP